MGVSTAFFSFNFIATSANPFVRAGTLDSTCLLEGRQGVRGGLLGQEGKSGEIAFSLRGVKEGWIGVRLQYPGHGAHEGKYTVVSSLNGREVGSGMLVLDVCLVKDIKSCYQYFTVLNVEGGGRIGGGEEDFILKIEVSKVWVEISHVYWA